MTKFVYAEMSCNLEKKKFDENIPLEGLVVKPIDTASPDNLFACYVKAFDKGDAKFFKSQNDAERRRYFNEELGFPDILTCPGSFAYKIKDELIGFAFVMPYQENNYHISCMCVLPEYQNMGIGKAMLNRIKNIAVENGCKTLSLGTEPEMKAFTLYEKNGFKIIHEHEVEL